MIGNVSHGCKLSCSGWHLLQCELHLDIPGCGQWLEIGKVEMVKDRVDVGMLGQVNGTGLMITLHLDAKCPVELP